MGQIPRNHRIIKELGFWFAVISVAGARTILSQRSLWQNGFWAEWVLGRMIVDGG